MAVFFPDIIQHNNPNLAVVDSDFSRGGRRVVADLTAMYALSLKPDQLKQFATIVYVQSEQKDYILIDINNADNSNGWQVYKYNSLPPTIEKIERLNITAVNTIAPLSQTPVDPTQALILINGIIYDSLGSDPAFSISGTAVQWLNSNAGFDLNTDDRVLIRYFIH
jgi:hypothetical protein